MVEHSAVNRVVVGSSPTRGGSPIGLDNLDSHAMKDFASQNARARCKQVQFGLARHYSSLREGVLGVDRFFPLLRSGPLLSTNGDIAKW